MEEAERLRNADFLQIAAHLLETGESDAAREAIYDVVSELHGTEFDREANTLAGAAMHARFGRFSQAQEYVGEAFDALVRQSVAIPVFTPDRKV